MMQARRLLAGHEGVLCGVLAVILIIAARLQPAFVSPATQMELALHAIEIALLAVPMTLIVIAGGIDLSVGSAMALSAVTLGLLHEAGVPVGLAAAAGVAVGVAAGLLNGVLIACARVHPLLVTLATMATYRGLAEGLSGGRPFSGFPDGLLEIGAADLLGVPVLILFVAVVACLAGLAAVRTAPGRWVYAIGGNETAAAHCAVPLARLKIALFGLAGLVAGLSGVIFAARRNTAKADIGTGIELEVITAVVLGGTSIFGGRGTVLGTMLGVVIVHELREFVSWHWQNDESILIAVGVILISSVALNTLLARRSR